VRYSARVALLCPQCGAVLSEGAASCSRCNASLAPSDVKPGTRWVKVEVQLRCRLCGLMSPVVPMHASEVVRCERCEREQAFDPAVWPEVMDQARKALASNGPVQGEVIVADDLPRKVGVALQVSGIADEPPQMPSDGRQYIPASDTYRGGARVGWFRLAEDAEKDGIAPNRSKVEDAEEAARDKRGFVRNSLLILAECALLFPAVLIWKGTSALSSTFWVAFGIGLVLNVIWGWACFSLAQRREETDVWVYYVMATLPQALWLGVTVLASSW